MISWSETSLSAHTSSKNPGLVVFQKTFLPGWKAKLDGRVVPTLRCDGVLLGVAVPEGKHRLDLQFDPTALRLGFFISLLTLASALFILLTPARFP
jgi:uncharacterized membrane protein YfhO